MGRIIDWRDFEDRIRARGADDEDAAALVAHARGFDGFAPGDLGAACDHGPGPRPATLDRLAATGVSDEVLSLALDEVADGLALGPAAEEPRAVWSLLFREGCPVGHLPRTLWHCFRDERADPQDWGVVDGATALGRARRYVALGFPVAEGPWVGLGCLATLDALRARFASMLQHGAPAIFLERDLRYLRRVCSDAVVERIDARVGPPFDASRDADGEGRSAPEDWLAALDAAVAGGEVVRDAARDRFTLVDEARGVPRRRPRVGVPPRPDGARSRAVAEALAGWIAAESADVVGSAPWLVPDIERSLAHRPYLDPLAWLDELVRLAEEIGMWRRSGA